MQLVLASTSRYRQSLLQKLALPFTSGSPDIDEHPHAEESAEQLVLRLAVEKAQAIASDFTNHLIIGCDQVCIIDQQIVGKPHTRERAITQLSRASGQRITFMTGLALYNSRSKRLHTHLEPFDVQFRELSRVEIEAYLDLDQPFDCAGSFKCEGAGIMLFEALEGRDPNALTGLPLIALCNLLRAEGFNPLTEATP